MTVEGKTYLYEGGVKFCGGQKEFRGSRYFHEDGHMAVNEWVDVNGERKHFGADGVLDDGVEVPSSGEGWTELSGNWFYMVDDAPKKGWLVTAEVPPIAGDAGLQRYWLDATNGVLAVDKTVEYSSGKFTHAMPAGYVARGVMNDGNHRVYYADNDGNLLCMDQGWHIGSDLVVADGLQRYYMTGDGSAQASFFEVDGASYYGRESTGYVLRGVKKDSDKMLVANNDGKLAESYGDAGWLVTDKLTGTLERYYLEEVDGHLWCPCGFFTVDGSEYYGCDEGYVLRGSLWDAGTRQLVIADNDGRVTKKLPANTLATASYDGVTCPAWDFEDWDFVERMRAYANEYAYSSATNWFFTVDVDAPVRAVIFHWEDGAWVPAGGWYVSTGRKYDGIYGNLPREAGGFHKLTNRWLPNTPAVPTGPGYAVDFIEYYPSPDVNDSASIHAGRAMGEWGYTTHSCIAMTAERSHWCYDNLGYGTGMYIAGSCGGIHDGALQGEEIHTATLVNPFA